MQLYCPQRGLSIHPVDANCSSGQSRHKIAADLRAGNESFDGGSAADVMEDFNSATNLRLLGNPRKHDGEDTDY